MLGQEGRDRDDETGRAEAALQAVGLSEGLLYRVERSVVGREALHRGHLAAHRLDREQQARADGVAVEEHGAGPAHAVLARQVGARQLALLAQRIAQRRAVLDHDPALLAVHGQSDSPLGHVAPLGVSHPAPRAWLDRSPGPSAPRPPADGTRRSHADRRAG